MFSTLSCINEVRLCSRTAPPPAVAARPQRETVADPRNDVAQAPVVVSGHFSAVRGTVQAKPLPHSDIDNEACLDYIIRTAATAHSALISLLHTRSWS
jgi:hypothetical protein